MNIALPRGVIEALITNYIAEYNSTAEILKFNHEHSQWDLLTGHLLINAGRAELIRTCAAALAQENASDEPRPLGAVGSGRLFDGPAKNSRK